MPLLLVKRKCAWKYSPVHWHWYVHMSYTDRQIRHRRRRKRSNVSSLLLIFADTTGCMCMDKDKRGYLRLRMCCTEKRKRDADWEDIWQILADLSFISILFTVYLQSLVSNQTIHYTLILNIISIDHVKHIIASRWQSSTHAFCHKIHNLFFFFTGLISPVHNLSS